MIPVERTTRLFGGIVALSLANKLNTFDTFVSEGGMALVRFRITRHIDIMSVYLKKIIF